MNDKKYLLRANEIASQSPEPIGCGVIIVSKGKIIAEAFNSQRTDNIAVNHAEIKAIIAANKHQKSRTLEGAITYCSCEPCAMCLTALSYAKVERIVFHQSMGETFPNDRQSSLDAHAFLQGLNYIPKLEQLKDLT